MPQGAKTKAFPEQGPSGMGGRRARARPQGNRAPQFVRFIQREGHFHMLLWRGFIGFNSSGLPLFFFFFLFQVIAQKYKSQYTYRITNWKCEHLKLIASLWENAVNLNGN